MDPRRNADPPRRTAFAAWFCCLALIGCDDPRKSEGAPPDPFVELAGSAGIDFVHFNGMTGERYIAEMMGPGAALFDYDNDGDLDVYLVQGAALEPGAAPERPPVDRLYRNDLEDGLDGRPALRFTDVTTASGLEAGGYGMGVVTGDFDNDGWTDLYLTNFGPNQLWRNNGDGTFRDVTRESGTDDRRFSVPAAFFDFDRDGLLDLYVGNYVNFRVATHRQCLSPSGRRDYCGPLAYDPLPDRLFRNRGDGTFDDVTSRAGLAGVKGNALGALPADFDLDGWVDLYVANDTQENNLWINRGDGTFVDRALVAGCAINADGQPEGSMGVDAGDIDGDGDDDLLMTHMSRETNTLYVNRGAGEFEDGTIASGLGAPSRDFTGFGVAWLDYDNDGRLDAIVANGEVKSIEEQVEQGDPLPLRQPNQLYRNDGDGKFREVTGRAVRALGVADVTRGLAVGDIDNDGDADVLLVNNNGPARLMINQVGQQAHWIGLRLEGDLPGTRVALFRPSRPTLWRLVRTAGSYASASDPRVLFGLGESAEVERVRVVWPDGGIEEWDDLPVDRYTTLRPGEGRTIASDAP